MHKLNIRAKTLMKGLPSIRVYFYLFFLALASTSLFISLLLIVP
ncbi:MAG: hypothetical protein WEB30_11280 [Cyclobacteriaceae bacterium]